MCLVSVFRLIFIRPLRGSTLSGSADGHTDRVFVLGSVKNLVPLFLGGLILILFLHPFCVCFVSQPSRSPPPGNEIAEYPP